MYLLSLAANFPSPRRCLSAKCFGQKSEGYSALRVDRLVPEPYRGQIETGLKLMEISARHLVFHATVVLLIGLLYGAPYARAIKRNLPAHVVHSWRVAHQSIPLGAALMFAVAGILTSFAVGPVFKWAIVGSLIVSSYAFCVSTPLAAITENRGLQRGSQGLAGLVYWGNMVGAGTSLLAATLLAVAGFLSI